MEQQCCGDGHRGQERSREEPAVAASPAPANVPPGPIVTERSPESSVPSAVTDGVCAADEVQAATDARCSRRGPSGQKPHRGGIGWHGQPQDSCGYAAQWAFYPAHTYGHMTEGGYFQPSWGPGHMLYAAQYAMHGVGSCPESTPPSGPVYYPAAYLVPKDQMMSHEATGYWLQGSWGHAAVFVPQPPPPPRSGAGPSHAPSAAHGRHSSRGTATSFASCSVAVSEDSDEDALTSSVSSASASRLPTSPATDHCSHAGGLASSAAGQAPDTGWGSLTVSVLQAVVGKLGDGEAKVLRCVCRHWRNVVDHHLETLTPSELQAKVLVLRFPNLKSLQLTHCANIRNRSLHIISRAGLSLQTLTLGDDTRRPWVTNEGLACIATMTSLTSLNLHDCSGVTNNGLAPLTKLRRLRALSLKGCRKLTSGAFESLQRHPALTELSLTGCRVTDKGLLPLTGLRLVSLRLGNTRVRDEGLSYLARITTLRELHFDHEELSDAGVAQLSTLTQLESLALRDCANVSGDALSTLVPALPNLISLDLNKNFTIDDGELSRCLEFLSAVTFLDLRGTPVTDGGLSQLTRLSCLQKLCLAPTNECLWSPYLCVVSNLTQLTSLSISNCTLMSFGQLEALRRLKLLRELDLSHDVWPAQQHGGGASTDGGGMADEAAQHQAVLATHRARQQQLNVTAVDAMAAITSLTSIDLSRRPVHEQHLSTLAERLPRLNSLIIVGCPVLTTEVAALQRRFPSLIIHRKPTQRSDSASVSCSCSEYGGA